MAPVEKMLSTKLSDESRWKQAKEDQTTEVFMFTAVIKTNFGKLLTLGHYHFVSNNYLLIILLLIAI